MLNWKQKSIISFIYEVPSFTNLQISLTPRCFRKLKEIQYVCFVAGLFCQHVNALSWIDPHIFTNCLVCCYGNSNGIQEEQFKTMCAKYFVILKAVICKFKAITNYQQLAPCTLKTIYSCYSTVCVGLNCLVVHINKIQASQTSQMS